MENQDFEIFVNNSLGRIWRFQKDYYKKSGRYHKNLMDIWEVRNKTRGDSLDPYLAAGNKYGYNYHMVIDTVSHTTWTAAAWPVSYGITGYKSYFINETGKIRAGDNKGLKGGENLPIIELKADY
ncbi:hypothetical protein ACFL27_12070 [candidate division CSSED10-310 bacterium]|uniref:Uncharacterized protein n=1 Tax=candidate division CSSED10-310 bacterium TaxID=2855610 RepID=A0ABV6YXI5_UNCC1